MTTRNRWDSETLGNYHAPKISPGTAAWWGACTDDLIWAGPSFVCRIWCTTLMTSNASKSSRIAGRHCPPTAAGSSWFSIPCRCDVSSEEVARHWGSRTNRTCRCWFSAWGRRSSGGNCWATEGFPRSSSSASYLAICSSKRVIERGVVVF